MPTNLFRASDSVNLKRYRKRIIATKHRRLLNYFQRKEVSQIANRVVSKRNVDKKYVAIGVPTIGDTMGYVDLTQITTGTTNYQRDDGGGANILVKRIHISGEVFHTTLTNSKLIFIIFVWHPDRSIDPPSTGDVLENDGTAYAPFSELEIDNKQKCTILYRSRIITQYDLAANVTFPHFTCNLKGLKRRVLYHSGDTNGQSGTNHLYMGIVSTSTVVGDNPSFRYDAEVYFEEQ